MVKHEDKQVDLFLDRSVYIPQQMSLKVIVHLNILMPKKE